MSSIEQAVIKYAAKVEPLDRYSVGSRMTTPSQISGPRAVMVNHNYKHMVAYDKPEFPRMFTGSENGFASFSASITKLDEDCEVFDIIRKDEYNALYIIKQLGTQYFRVIERYEVDEVSESFGIKYNNKILDAAKIGDILKAGTIIQKSANFDKYGNYRYVKNINVVYLVSTMNLEDGITLMNDADKELSVIKAKKQRIKISNNDIFLNLRGDDEKYNALPKVGEEVKDGIFAVIRKKTNQKVWSSLSKKDLQRIKASDKKIYANGTVTGYDFYHNQDFQNLTGSKAAEQLNDLIKADRDYHKEVFRKLGNIIEHFEYCDKIAFFYTRSKAFLNPKDLNQDDNDTVNNIIMDVHFLDTEPCTAGTKLVGRYGNKGGRKASPLCA